MMDQSKRPASVLPLPRIAKYLASSPAASNVMKKSTITRFDFDVSCTGTVDADCSYRSACHDVYSSRPARVIGDKSCLAGRDLKRCLKVSTQRESLARISNADIFTSRLPSVSEQKSVRFDSLQIREYDRVLSDNPSTSSGPPIGIGWRYSPEETVVDLEEYETAHEDLRRTKRELAIPPFVRERMLREAGFSRNEIKLATKRVKKDKEQRIHSVQHQKFDPLIERVETVKKGVAHLLKRRSSDLWQ